MTRVVLFLSVCAVLLPPAAARTDDAARAADKLGEEFFSALEQVLNMTIAARVSEAGKNAVWNVESSKSTIPGRSVSIKLVGNNIVIMAEFTPYLEDDNSLVLMAHGQVWISSPADEPLKYLSTLKTIPIHLGERVLFFPLGAKTVEATSDNTYDIELEIKILPSAETEHKAGSY